MSFAPIEATINPLQLVISSPRYYIRVVIVHRKIIVAETIAQNKLMFRSK